MTILGVDDHRFVKMIGIETAAFRNATTVLSVSSTCADSLSLEHIFHEPGWSNLHEPEWRLIVSATLDLALNVLQEMPIPIVLCDSDMCPGTWRAMLDHLSLHPDPPLLIVTRRLADERLWAEALNLGVFDLLAKPYESKELSRILSLALQHWLDRHDIHSGRTQQRTVLDERVQIIDRGARAAEGIR